MSRGRTHEGGRVNRGCVHGVGGGRVEGIRKRGRGGVEGVHTGRE